VSDEVLDPLTELAKGAAQIHEMFTAYVDAGFSRPEALQIIIGVLTAAMAANHLFQNPDQQ
jgi:hypothetical protein